MELYEEKCKFHLSCTSNICPLDPDIALRNYIPEDKSCKHIMLYLEGRETPFEKEIKETESIWRKKMGEWNIEKCLKGRERVRSAFRNAEK